MTPLASKSEAPPPLQKQKKQNQLLRKVPLNIMKEDIYLDVNFTTYDQPIRYVLIYASLLNQRTITNSYLCSNIIPRMCTGAIIQKPHAFLIWHMMWRRSQTHRARLLGGFQTAARQKWPWRWRIWNPVTYPAASQVHEIVSGLAYGNWLVCWLLKRFLFILLLNFTICVRWLLSVRT